MPPSPQNLWHRTQTISKLYSLQRSIHGYSICRSSFVNSITRIFETQEYKPFLTIPRQF